MGSLTLAGLSITLCPTGKMPQCRRCHQSRSGRDQNGGLSSLREPARSQIAIVFFAGHGLQFEGRNRSRCVPGGSIPEVMTDMDTSRRLPQESDCDATRAGAGRAVEASGLAAPS